MKTCERVQEVRSLRLIEEAASPFRLNSFMGTTGGAVSIIYSTRATPTPSVPKNTFHGFSSRVAAEAFCFRFIEDGLTLQGRLTKLTI